MQSSKMVFLRLNCVEETVTDQQGNIHTSHFWVDAEDDVLIHFQLYKVFDQAQVNQSILINDQLFTVVKVIEKSIIKSCNCIS